MPILWDKKTKANILPTTLSQPPSLSPEKVKKLFEQTTKNFEAIYWERGLEEGELRKETEQALKILKAREVAELSQGTLTALLGILQSDGSLGERESQRRVDLLIGGWGPVRTLVSFVKAYDLRTQDCKNGEGHYLVSRSFGDVAPHGFWFPLRRRLLEVTKEQRKALVETAEELRKDLDKYTRCMISFLFPECQDWIDQDLKDSRNGPFVLCCGWGPLINVEPARLAKLWPDYHYEIAPALLWTVLDKMGEQALPLVLDMMGDRWDGVEFLDPLSIAGTPEVAELMLRCLEKTRTRKRATAFFENFPELAFPRLVTCKAKSNGTVLLETLVHAHPEKARDAVGCLEAKLARKITSLLEVQEQVVEEAPSDSVPQWLVSPPWSEKRRRPKLPKLERPATLGYEERIDWRFPLETENLERDSADEREVLLQIEEEGPELEDCLYLSREAALRVFDATPVERWQESHWDQIAPRTLWLLGLALLPTLVKLGSRFPNSVKLALAQVDSPRCATFWAEQLKGKKNRALAREWFELYPEAAVIGLVPELVSSTGKQQTLILQALDAVRCSGHQAILDSVLARYGEDIQRALGPRLSSDLLACHPAKAKALPDFWRPGNWPRPVLRESGEALSLASLNVVGEALSFELPYDYPGLRDIRSLCDWDEFLWALFQAWDQAGGPSKYGWALRALGILGGNGVARELALKLKDWPRQNLFARAVTGLDILERIGTDEALMYLDELSKKLKSEALRARAIDRLHHIARRRGLTTEQLQDRLVPDLGLDSKGGMKLDFGARSFQVGFDESLAPYVLDEKGKRRKSLPKAAKADEPEKAKAAHRLWKGLKKDARKLSGLQLERFETAMCTGRRWSPSEFRNFVLEHPLLIHLARRLVWGVYEQDCLTTTFRVCEDKTLADESDEALNLPDELGLGVAHPLEFEIAGWSTTFADYELLQPFPQLERAVFPATPEELDSPTITRYQGRTIEQNFLYRLKTRAWRQGPVEDGPSINSYTKTFDRKRYAYLSFSPGISVGSGWEQRQTLDQVRFYDGDDQARPGPILFSELVRDMEALVRPES